MKKMAIGRVIIIASLLSILSSCDREKGGLPAGLSIGSKAPDFSITDISGQAVSLRDFSGKNVLINFWATWCFPCREEMDDLQAVYEKNKERGLVILGVNMKENREIVTEFIKKYKITYPVLMDLDGKVSEAYNVFGLPTSIFIDNQGVIRDIVLGEMQEDTIAEKVGRLMSRVGIKEIPNLKFKIVNS